MTKCQKFPLKLSAQHLETISFVACHHTSYTFHTFPPKLHIFPSSTARQALFMSGKASHHFSTKTAPTTDKATVLGNQSQTYSWLPWRRIKPSGQPRRERGVIYPSVLITPQCFCGLTKTYLDDPAGGQIMSMNILPHRSVSKHKKGRVHWKIGSQETSWLVTSACTVGICCWAIVVSTLYSQSAHPHTLALMIPVTLDLVSLALLSGFFH